MLVGGSSAIVAAVAQVLERELEHETDVGVMERV